MSNHDVHFDVAAESVAVQTGALLTEAARLAGVELLQPCGGQGRCGRCMVRVVDGAVRSRSTLRLSRQDLERGYALACQSVVEADVSVTVPPQEKVERRLSTERTAAEVSVPETREERIAGGVGGENRVLCQDEILPVSLLGQVL
jgi:uncharacterized 2Fe-2S/4Fe-4S cluster protein (DUF4445 family)